jgi:hypothetical protein
MGNSVRLKLCLVKLGARLLRGPVVFCFLFFLIGLCIDSHSSAFAYGSSPSFSSGFGSIEEVQKKKESSRWTIEGWLSQKQKIQWMNYWLAMNTAPLDFEISLGGNRGSHKSETNTIPGLISSTESLEGEISVYYRIIGFTAEYRKPDADSASISALFNLRVIGTSLQASQLTLHYGLREFISQDPLEAIEKQQVAGVSTTLYLFDFFGLESHYRKELPVTSKGLTKIENSIFNYGLFIELGFLKLYGNIVEESSIQIPPAASEMVTKGKGSEFGVQLYF